MEAAGSTQPPPLSWAGTNCSDKTFGDHEIGHSGYFPQNCIFNVTYVGATLNMRGLAEE